MNDYHSSFIPNVMPVMLENVLILLLLTLPHVLLYFVAGNGVSSSGALKRSPFQQLRN